MKPLKLTLSAFGSYGDKEVIDFSRISGGIFLIAGETGAGKTTLFDGITYALYNETSGGIRDGDMMRSQYAKESTPTYVELSFLQDGKSYQIRRNPNYLRLSKRKNKDGKYVKTKESAKVELIMSDGTVFPGNRKETDQKILEIVGLTMEQFTQISMIAQGQFLDLLLASSKERKKIFSKIFQTRIYGKIQEKLSEKDKFLYLEQQKNQIRWEEQEKAIAYPEEAKTQIIGSTLEGKEQVLLKLNEIIFALSAEEKESKKEIRRLQTLLEQQIQLMEQEKERKKLEDDLKRNEMLLSDLTEKKPVIEQKKEELHRANMAEQVIAKEKVYSSFLERHSKIETDIFRLTSTLPMLKEDTKKAKETYEQERKNWEIQSPKIMQDFLRLEDALPLYEKVEEEEKALKKMENSLLVLEQKRKEQKESIKRLEARNQELSVKLEEYRELSILLHEAEKENQELDFVVKQLESFYGEKDQIKEKERKRNQLLKEAETSIQIFRQKEHRYQELNLLFLKNQAGILASNLKEGDPCPVCGSCHHPQIAGLDEKGKDHSISENKVEEARRNQERAREEAQKKSDQAGNALEELKISIARMEEKANRFLPGFVCEEEQWERLEKEIVSTKEKRESRVIQWKLLKEKQEDKERKEKELELLITKQEKIQESLQKNHDTYLDLSTDFGTRKGILEQEKKTLLYGSYEEAFSVYHKRKQEIRQIEDHLNLLQKKWEANRKLLDQKAGILEGKKQEEKEQYLLLEKSKKEFEDVLKQQGFEAESDYQKAKELLPLKGSMEKQIKDYEDRILSLTSVISQNKERLENTQKRDMDQLEKDRSALLAQKEEAEKREKEIYSVLTSNRGTKTKLMQIYQQTMETEKEYEKIHPLCETANGRLSGSAKLDFQTYMQRRYFKRIIEAANRRLAPMSRNRFTLSLRDISSLSLQGEAGLDLDVYSLVTGTIRDVKTLSGGESFLAALSMALGLADIIGQEAGKIQVDTLFIDEGFGSLDEESRRQAMEVLVSLTEGNRLVGIISHVAELQEQIDQKLMITKNINGSHASWED